MRQQMRRMAVVVAACFCVGLSMGFTKPSLCPDPSTVSATTNHPVLDPVNLEFVNDAGIDVSVFWVNHAGKEVPVGVFLCCHL